MRRLFAAPIIALVLVGGWASYAADVDDVKAAVDGYHAAISSLDLAKIVAVWAHDGTVIDKSLGIRPSLWVGKERERSSRA